MNVLRWYPFVHLFDTPFQNSPYGHADAATRGTLAKVVKANSESVSEERGKKQVIFEALWY